MPTKYKYKGTSAKAVKSTFYLFFLFVCFFLIKKLIFQFVIMGYCVLNFEVKINLE